MKLVSLHLQNFQAHKDRLIEFSPGITTIKGATDTGKSAIIRALRWVTQNAIAGDEFIRMGAKQAEVSLVVEVDDVEVDIVREKGGTNNAYYLNGDKMKAFGQGVPEPIAKLLQLGDINFQDQHDSPFWFAETAGEVSRRLNAVIDLSIIDSALGYVAAEVRKGQERISICEERLQELTKQFKEVEPQEARIDDFGKLERLNDAQEHTEGDRSILEELLNNIRSNRARELGLQSEQAQFMFQSYKEFLAISEDREHLQDYLRNIDTTQRRAVEPPVFAGVEASEKALGDAEFKTDSLRILLEDVKSAQSKIRFVPEGWNELARYREAAFVAEGNRTALGLLMRQISDQDYILGESKADLEQAEQRFHERIKGARCPICGGTLE